MSVVVTAGAALPLWSTGKTSTVSLAFSVTTSQLPSGEKPICSGLAACELSGSTFGRLGDEVIVC